MRRLLPLWSSLVAVLLLTQWAWGLTVCIGRMQPGVVCHVAGDGPAPAFPDSPGAPCQLCTPLPPALAAAPGPAVPPPRVAAWFAPAAMAASLPAPAAAPMLVQARAPPPVT